jgi:hypothetical protein
MDGTTGLGYPARGRRSVAGQQPFVPSKLQEDCQHGEQPKRSEWQQEHHRAKGLQHFFEEYPSRHRGRTFWQRRWPCLMAAHFISPQPSRRGRTARSGRCVVPARLRCPDMIGRGSSVAHCTDSAVPPRSSCSIARSWHGYAPSARVGNSGESRMRGERPTGRMAGPSLPSGLKWGHPADLGVGGGGMYRQGNPMSSMRRRRPWFRLQLRGHSRLGTIWPLREPKAVERVGSVTRRGVGSSGALFCVCQA